ncbi:MULTISPECIES: MFS transporter [Thermocrispum]|mgnify:CR=1 FL=1|uniref:MFS transporter n=1 Tax=Thermocrispum TaxID=37924 RepID=UPI0004048B20|nr:MULTISPECIES: MFS transporter [Thermocrispum]
MSTPGGDRLWRSVVLSALLPLVLYSTGVGALMPAIPLIVARISEPLFDDRSTILAVSGVVAAMLMVGELIGYLPSGRIVTLLGERNAMLAAAGLSLAGIGVCMLLPGPWAVGVGVFLVGLATALFSLARHAFITTYVPLVYRSRVLAAVGGLFRLGHFVGPFLTAYVLSTFGSLESAYWIHVATCTAAAVVLLFTRDPETAAMKKTTARAVAAAPRSAGIARTLVNRRDVLLRLGTGAAVVMALRAGRTVIMPLWGVSIGMDDSSVALVVGIAGGVDFALCYLGGWLCDRFGRMWNALPSTLGLALSLLVLAFTAGFANPAVWFVVLTMTMSVANGMGTGIVLTLGADLADPEDPAPFLGAWRFIGSLGNAGAPLAVSAATTAVSLPFAVGALGVIGIAGAAILAHGIARYIPGESLRLRSRRAQPR